jgi:hypothetical protein
MDAGDHHDAYTVPSPVVRNYCITPLRKGFLGCVDRLHDSHCPGHQQGVGDIPAEAHQNNVWREMSPCEADRHRRSPPWQHGSEGETIPQIAANENSRQNPAEPWCVGRYSGPRWPGVAGC